MAKAAKPASSTWNCRAKRTWRCASSSASRRGRGCTCARAASRASPHEGGPLQLLLLHVVVEARFREPEPQVLVAAEVRVVVVDLLPRRVLARQIGIHRGR